MCHGKTRLVSVGVWCWNPTINNSEIWNWNELKSKWTWMKNKSSYCIHCYWSYSISSRSHLSWGRNFEIECQRLRRPHAMRIEQRKKFMRTASEYVKLDFSWLQSHFYLVVLEWLTNSPPWQQKCEFANSELEKRLYALNLGFHGLKFGEYDIHM